ncbi:hypothetical protein K501DRAFT_67605 [Backusella circina FSU 941]|nr:hypothetical protein K501DRAFT_67605 [Backusella circina FSU 941]
MTFLFLSFLPSLLFYYIKTMGCCMSHDQFTTAEVILDENGRATRVKQGHGTHYLTTYLDRETKLERKPPVLPSQFKLSCRPPQPVYSPKAFMTTQKKVYPQPSAIIRDEK